MRSAPSAFHVVGHDWGGQVAWLTAAHHADRVSALTVLSRPHPAAFARSFDLDPEQATRSRHHRDMGPEMTDRWHADDSALLRTVLAGAGVPDRRRRRLPRPCSATAPRSTRR